MARPVTLFTGQWADLPLEELAPLAREMGYDGLELACWGDHFEVNKALQDDGYVERQREILERNGLECFAIGNHLVGLINNGLTLMGLEFSQQQIVRGAIIILAVALARKGLR